MIVHPSYTPIRTQNGHQLTLENIFQGLLYRLKLRINHTYQMVNEGKYTHHHGPPLPPKPIFLSALF